MIKQRGAALIIVLLALSMISVVAIDLSARLSFQSRLLQQQLLYQQSYWYLLAAESFATSVLKSDLEANTTNLSQTWAQRDVILPIEGGSLAGNIYDETACFNLNALAAGEVEGETIALPYQVFERLVELLELDPDEGQLLLERARDWVDSDSTPTGYNGLEYGFQTPNGISYLAPNSSMSSLSEIHLFSELSKETLDRLLPYLCVTPKSDALEVNINSLTAENAALLAALSLGRLDESTAADLIDERPDDGYDSINALFLAPAFADNPLKDNEKAMFTVKSRYFRADILVSFETAQRRYQAWFEADKDTLITYARQYGDLP